MVVQTCIQRDSGQQPRKHNLMQAFGLSQNVFARKVVTALPEQLNQRMCKIVAGDKEGVIRLAAWVVLLQPINLTESDCRGLCLEESYI